MEIPWGFKWESKALEEFGTSSSETKAAEFSRRQDKGKHVSEAPNILWAPE